MAVPVSYTHLDVYKRQASSLKGRSPASFGIGDLGGKLLFDYKQLDFFHVDVDSVEKRGIVLNIPLRKKWRFFGSFIFYFIAYAFHNCCLCVFGLSEYISVKVILCSDRMKLCLNRICIYISIGRIGIVDIRRPGMVDCHI